MKYYLAYGSNLNLSQMFWRCPHARVIGYTFLPGMRLVFRGSKTGSYLTVEPGEAAAPAGVPCGVFAICDGDELALDRYEGYPVFYQKQTLRVPEVMAVGTKDVVLRDIDAMIYTMPTDHPLGLPSTGYWRTCKQGYRDFHFGLRHLEKALFDSRAGLIT